MNSEEDKIVAVNSPEEDDRQWHLRLYESQIARDVHKTYNPEKENYDTWSLCRPAEDVWPDIFLGWERRAGEQTADAVAMESALVQRLRKQIRWLCEQLGRRSNCCPPKTHCIVQTPCPDCWEWASLKVAKGESDA